MTALLLYSAVLVLEILVLPWRKSGPIIPYIPLLDGPPRHNFRRARVAHGA